MAQATKKRASAGKRSSAAAKQKEAAALDRAQTRALASATLKNGAAIEQLKRVLREVGGIVCFFTAIILALALFTFNVNDPGWSHTGTSAEVNNSVGRAGAFFADISLSWFGYMAYLIPALLLAGGWILFSEHRRKKPRKYQPFAFIQVIGIALLLLTASGLADLHFGVTNNALPENIYGGGILGSKVASSLVVLLNALGTTLLLLALFFCSLTMVFGTSWIALIERMGELVIKVIDRGNDAVAKFTGKFEERRKVRAADAARRERVKSVPVATVGDPLFDSDDLGVPKTGLAAALAAARDRAKSAAQSIGGKSPADNVSHSSGLTSAPDIDARLSGVLAAQDKNEVVATPVKQALARAKAASAGTGANAGEKQSADALLDNEDVKKPVAPSVAAKESVNDAAPQRKKKIAIKQRVPEQKQTKLFLDVPDSELPPISLLDAPEPQRPGFSDAELEGLSRLLEDKLAEFRITVEVVAVHPGPVITRFEMQLAPGIKASRITNLSQDIARSLSLVSVRVVEVIPGKSTIGIEVPNEHREIVQLSEMLQSDEYNTKGSPLTLALGKDISGQPVTADLGRMPHLLVAGTTGAGKSVAVNSMLVSLLYKATPNDVRLILIDPKMLELNVYDGIPHLLTPVVTDMKEAANALRWCVGEMERRYTLMAELKVRNITGYNKKIRDAIDADTPIVDPLYKAELSLEPTAAPPTLEPMPFIVVVVDEFADMMMQVGKKAEEMIARIAQKARAAGIHLILATQRPSVDVITGLIKANIPTRIAFQVSQKVDSRTILDQGGAESLLGHGDMLYLPPGTAVPVRVHGAFVDDHEVNNVAGHIRATGEPNYIEEILQEATMPIPGLSGSGDESAEHDELYDQAVAIVTESRKASISYVQRRLKIGYNRAARMVEEMESAGVVSTVTGSGTREVLAPPPV